jgi:hypothetical protein
VNLFFVFIVPTIGLVLQTNTIQGVLIISQLLKLWKIKFVETFKPFKKKNRQNIW